MYSKNYVVETIPSENKWINVAEHYNEKKKNNLSIMYIGRNSDTLQSLSPFFHYHFVAQTYQQAQALIEQYIEDETQLPDSIFIDIHLHKEELVNFLTFLKEKNLLCKTPVIYNQNQLSHHKIKFLKKLEVIDDIADFNSRTIDFRNKILFLGRVKDELAEEECYEKIIGRKERFTQRVSSALKRSFDIIVSLTVLIIASPILLLTAIAIKLESKGSVFYTSLRAGKGYRIIKFYKFRSMEENSDKKMEDLRHLNQYDSSEKGPKFFKLNKDPRVTKVGKFLRNTSLDELPQLLNVLKGDMSIVGNRPLPLYEAETLTTNEFVERFTAPAGITGLWQVKKRGKSEMSIDERINLDISYARNNNFLFDMGIIFSTPKALFQRSDV